MNTSHAAGWASDAPSPAQLAEFFRQCQGQKPRITKGRLQAFLRSGGKPEGYDLAHLILVDDFLSPEEVYGALNFTCSEAHMEHLAQTLPSVDVLRWCRRNDYLVLPQPPVPLSLLGVKKLDPKLFYTSVDGWYENPGEQFSREELTTGPWLCIRKGVVPKSTGKNWDEQKKLLQEQECVPNAANAVWAFTTYWKVRGLYLVPSVYVMTSSGNSLSDGVRIGRFDDSGINVDYWSEHSRDGRVGLASALKL